MLRSPPKAGLRTSTPSTSYCESPTPPGQGKVPNDRDLPLLQASRAKKLHCHMAWLQAEQRAERSKVKKLENCLSDSMLAEKTAQRRVHKQKEALEEHSHRLQEMQARMATINQELRDAERARSQTPASLPRSTQSRQEGGDRAQASTRVSTAAATSVMSRTSTRQGENSNPLDLQEVSGFQSALGSADGTRMERSFSAGSDAPLRRSPLMSRPGSKEGTPNVHASLEDTAAAKLLGDGDGEGPTLKEYMDASSPQPGSRGTEQRRSSGHRESIMGMLEAQDPAIDLTPPQTALAGPLGNAYQMTSSRSSTWRRSPPRRAVETTRQDEEEIAERIEQARNIIRRELCERAGSARAAFGKLDLNGSGNISSQEFADGVTSMGVNWGAITGLRRPRDLFSMFDQDKDAVITFPELFPDDVDAEDTRVSTPEFCKRYHMGQLHSARSPEWQASGVEDVLGAAQEGQQRSDESAGRRKWMSATIRRLKTRGKSDARCREVTAKHLPRGTGPKDREGVGTFSKVDLKSCRKKYTDEVALPMRTMWKVVGDFKEQRREQKRIYDKLFSVTEAAYQRQRQEELVKDLGLGFGKKEESGDKGSQKKSLPQLALETGLEQPELTHLQGIYTKFDNNYTEQIQRKGFARVLEELLPGVVFTDEDLDDMWQQVQQQTGSVDAEGAVDPLSSIGGSGTEVGGALGSLLGGPKKAGCSFEQFVRWWHQSELRELAIGEMEMSEHEG